MESRYEVGTFWKFEDNTLYFFVMGTFGKTYSLAYYDTLDRNVHYMITGEDTLDFCVPCTDLDINNIIIEAVSTQP